MPSRLENYIDTVFNNINAAAQSVALLVQSAYARRGLQNERASSKAADPASKAKGAEASLNGMAKSGLFEKTKITENCQKGKQNCVLCLLFSNCIGKSPNDFFKFLVTPSMSYLGSGLPGRLGLRGHGPLQLNG